MSLKRDVAKLGAAVARASEVVEALGRPAQPEPRFLAPLAPTQRATLFGGGTTAKRLDLRLAVALGARKTLFKGYPEFDPSQERDESGKWVGGGIHNQMGVESEHKEVFEASTKGAPADVIEAGKRALNAYTGMLGGAINTRLRDPEAAARNPFRDADMAVPVLDKLFEHTSLVKALEAERWLPYDVLQKLRNNMGGTVLHLGFTSLIMEGGYTDNINAKDYTSVIHVVPKGSRALPVAHLSKYQNEREVVVDRGSVWRVSMRGDRIVLTLEGTRRTTKAAFTIEYPNRRRRHRRMRAGRVSIQPSANIDTTGTAAAGLALKGYPEFDPSQERDEKGRFTAGGGNGDSDPGGLKQYLTSVNTMYGGRPSLFKLQLDHGKAYSVEGAKFTGSKKTQHKCYECAAKAAMANEDLTYVEGFVSVHGVPISHAWTVDKDGKVHDPTLRDGKGVLGYYGIPFKTQYLVETLMRRRVYGLLEFNSDVITDDPAKFVRKGYPEYNEAQPRGDDGRWSGGSGAGYVPMGPAQRLLARNLKLHPTPSREKFLASLKPEERQWLQRTLKRLEGLPPTHLTSEEGGFRNKDGTWVPGRAALHDLIIKTRLDEAMERAKPAPGEQPHVVFVGGRPASGKTPAVRDSGFVPNVEDYLYINADDLRGDNKLFRSGDPRYGLPGYEGWNSTLFHAEASMLADRLAREARALGLNVVQDATLRKVSNAQAMVDTYGEAGYRMSGLFVHSPPGVTAYRIINRAMRGSGRFVPSYVLGKAINERAFDAIRNRLDEWRLYDNSVFNTYKLVARGSGRRRTRKGYPEYSPDQARGPDGKWTAGGGAGGTGGRKRFRLVPNFIAQRGAERSKLAIQRALTNIPKAHYDKLVASGVKFRAVNDLGEAYRRVADPNYQMEPDEEGHFGLISGFYNQHLNAIFIGDTFDGFPLANPYQFVLHEIAHAIDFNTGFEERGRIVGADALSQQLWPTSSREYFGQSKIDKFYSEHYSASELRGELFAELYAVAYGDPGDAYYMGGLTRRQVLRRFPKSIAMIKSMDMSVRRPYQSLEDWLRLPRRRKAASFNDLLKGYPEYNPSQERGEDGKWVAGGGTNQPPSGADGYPGVIRGTKGSLQVFATPKGVKTARRLADAFKHVPTNHINALNGLPIYAVKDMHHLVQAVATRTGWQHSGAGMHAFFLPEVGIFIGETVDGFRLVNVPKTIVHEFAHALDFYSSDIREYDISARLGGTITRELEAMPDVLQFYAEHYKVIGWQREVFAEVYAAVHTGDTPATFLGGLSRELVFKHFPDTVKAVRRLRIPNTQTFKPTFRTPEWNKWFVEVYGRTAKRMLKGAVETSYA